MVKIDFRKVMCCILLPFPSVEQPKEPVSFTDSLSPRWRTSFQDLSAVQTFRRSGRKMGRRTRSLVCHLSAVNCFSRVTATDSFIFFLFFWISLVFLEEEKFSFPSSRELNSLLHSAASAWLMQVCHPEQVLHHVHRVSQCQSYGMCANNGYYTLVSRDIGLLVYLFVIQMVLAD